MNLYLRTPQVITDHALGLRISKISKEFEIMDLVMEAWRRFVIEAKEESDSQKKTLEIDVEGDDDDFEEGDEVEIDILDSDPDKDDEDDEISEWNADDDHDYPSRKKRRRNSKMLKPDRASWNSGYSDLKSLSKGRVGLDSVALHEAKKKRKPQCHAYKPFHGKDGKFVDPEKESGSSSMKPPDANSPS